MYTVRYTTYRVNNQHTQKNGGFLLYWKLYGQLLKMMKTTGVKPNPFVRFIKFWWFCVIKPLGQFYSCKTTFIGEYQVAINGRFDNINLIKRKTHKFFRVPIFSIQARLTDEDIANLTK